MSHSTKRIRSAFALTALLVIAVFFLFVSLGGVVGGHLHPRAVLSILIWMIPFGVYLLGVRTRAVTIAGGITLLAGTLWALIALFLDTASTAGIGIITLPPLLVLVAVVMVIVDLGLRDRGTQR